MSMGLKSMRDVAWRTFVSFGVTACLSTTLLADVNPSEGELPPELITGTAAGNTKTAERERALKAARIKQEKEAYDRSKETILPLTAEEIIRFRHEADAVEQARTRPLKVPEPTVRTLPLDISPGAMPEKVYLRHEFETAINLIDSSGRPWPVQRFWIGDAEAFRAQAGGPSTVLVKASERGGISNLNFYLEGMDEPIGLTVEYSEERVDYKATLVVPGAGPETLRLAEVDAARQAALLREIPSFRSKEMSAFLDGAAPPGARVIPVMGGAGTQAWAFKNKLVLRTDMTLVSPAHEHLMRSNGGYTVYVVNNPAPVIVMLRNGNTILANLDMASAGFKSRENIHGR